jgi:outer membrane lipopolysaccharide assembly protein LptE/RlpB
VAVSRTRSLASALIALLAVTGGCGYHLLSTAAADGRELTVSVVTLDNDSAEPGVELTVTRALREEFRRRAAPRLVADPHAADVVLRGRVLPLVVNPSSFSTVSLAIEYRVQMTLAVDVAVVQGAPLQIDPAALTASELYVASPDSEASRKNRSEALRRIADLLASRIHDAIGLQLAARRAGGEAS